MMWNMWSAIILSIYLFLFPFTTSFHLSYYEVRCLVCICLEERCNAEGRLEKGWKGSAMGLVNGVLEDR